MNEFKKKNSLHQTRGFDIVRKKITSDFTKLLQLYKTRKKSLRRSKWILNLELHKGKLRTEFLPTLSRLHYTHKHIDLHTKLLT